MKRRVLNVTTALSLPLFAALVTLWVRSYWVIEDISFEHTAGRMYQVSSANGHLTWEIARCSDSSDRAPLGLHYDATQLGPGDRFVDDWPAGYGPYFAGFAIGRWSRVEYDQCMGIQTPYWASTAMAAILPLSNMIAILRSKRRRHCNSCTACGYDLTGNVSGICPECGKPVPRSPETAA